ncbi:hypothetical protein [Phenylobacterium terrae]
MTWKHRPRFPAGGKPVGLLSHQDGFYRVRIRRKDYRLHRLSFFYMTGRWPERVRNISGDKDDNRWCNLEESSWDHERERKAQQAAERQAQRKAERAVAKATRDAERAKTKAEKEAKAAADKTERDARRAERQATAAQRRKEARRAYYKANPHLRRAAKSKRRAKIRGAKTEDADSQKIASIYEMRERMERLLDTPYHVDHVIPLSKGGLHHQDNLVVMRADFNQWKSDRILEQIIRHFTPYEPPEDK